MNSRNPTRTMGVHEYMVSRVARALGDDLVAETAFVGGCATALLVTDELVHTEVRFTDDVDVIVHVMGRGHWYQLERRLEDLGFRSSPIETDDPICRKRLRDGEPHELIVDFMPDEPGILDFSNRWYAEALESALEVELGDGSRVRVVTSPYFLATKLDAYRGRGHGDLLLSQDVEDILNVVNGRDSLLEEVRESPLELQQAIAQGLQELMEHPSFDYAVASAVRDSPSRETRVFQKLDALVKQPWSAS